MFNSVSFRDGKKYHYKKGDWERYIQPITNRLCEEYGLSTIELEEEPGKRRGRTGNGTDTVTVNLYGLIW